jgi:DNA-binding NtrC family response regulator
LPVLTRSAPPAPGTAAASAPPVQAPAYVAPAEPPPSELVPDSPLHLPESEPAPIGIATADEPAAPATAPAIVPLDELEKQAILSALRNTGGNRTKTAELLKISIRTLRNKLQEYRASGDFTDGDELDA